MDKRLIYIIEAWYNKIGLSEQIADIFAVITILAAIVVLSWLANYIAKNIIVVVIGKIVKRTSSRWDDVFFEKKVFHKLSHFAPAMIIYFTIDFAFPESFATVQFFNQLTFIYMLLICLLVIYAFLNALNFIYNETIGEKRGTSIKSYLQVVKIILTIFFVLLMLSMLLNRDVGHFLAGLGAMSAVLILVFKDSLLGLVGGIQITSNDMVRIGDWIEMPTRNADGDVIEISLNTVKVRNFDMTISTIPTYAMVTESYRNWRGMSESGGRRISRNIFIDQKSVKFCSEEMLNKFKKFHLLKPYIEEKNTEIDEFNKQHNLVNDTVVNGRKLTNLGMFRKYIELYLRNNPNIHKEMMLLIRHLAPSDSGIPIQIYAFTTTTVWKDYEGIQADIFDHLLAILPEFELKVFQHPTGSDFQNAFEKVSKS
jgi:miniconductance mechanosensitive channel